MVERNFKRRVALFFLCFWVISIHWTGAPRETLAQANTLSPENPGEAPMMVLPDTKFDFGEVDEGSEVSHDFTVKNTGKAELLINKVSRD